MSEGAVRIKTSTFEAMMNVLRPLAKVAAEIDAMGQGGEATLGPVPVAAVVYRSAAAAIALVEKDTGGLEWAAPRALRIVESPGSNVPDPSAPGMRIVGFRVHEDVAGMGVALLAIDEIRKAALRPATEADEVAHA
jgi:hypothetical protein